LGLPYSRDHGDQRRQGLEAGAQEAVPGDNHHSSDEWDGETAALRYPFKPKFDRRIGTDNGKRFDKRTGKFRKCRDTDDQPLKSKDKLELILHLDTIGIAGRLFLKNVQFMNLKGTGPTFVDRQSKARSRENEGKDETTN
jgi:hypothetical protein